MSLSRTARRISLPARGIAVITHPSYRVRPRGNMHSSIIMITHSSGGFPVGCPIGPTGVIRARFAQGR